MLRCDYAADRYGAACLQLAAQGKAAASFGAVLVSDGEIVARGRNRRSQPGESQLLGGGVDYAAHAEQAALIDALASGVTPSDGDLYVLGVARRGPRAGALSVRASDTDYQFSCPRCARALARFGVAVHIPLPGGWHRLEPSEALDGALAFRAAGRARVFTATEPPASVALAAA